MKRNLPLSFAILPFFMLSINLKAQRFDIGVAAIYGSDIGQLGQNTRFYVNSNDHRFCFGPEFSWFFTDDQTVGDERLSRPLIEFNFNAHINFKLTNKLSFYPVIGINYSQEQEDEYVNNELDHQLTIKEWGLLVGSGLHYDLGKRFILFSEYDHLFSDLKQSTYTLGILLSFGKIKAQHGEHH